MSHAEKVDFPEWVGRIWACVAVWGVQAGGMERLPVMKTPKCYVGGAFVRAESGRVRAWSGADGVFFANMPMCSRKDVRHAVEAAAVAGAGWAARSGYNRGQILYRLAEMLEPRSGEMAAALRLDGRAGEAAAAEVAASIDRIVHYAGWTDKYQALLGSVNPVASPHFSYTVTEPLGVVGVVAPDDFPLLGLVSMMLPIMASGNSVVAMASRKQPYAALLLGEMLATSDLPGGVVNVLTGEMADLLPTFATHEHMRGVAAVVTREQRITLEQGAAGSVKRVKCYEITDWLAAEAQGLYFISDFVEYKTMWHPVEC